MDLRQFLGDPAGRRSVDNVLPVQDRPNGLELLLGSRATQSQGGMALLGHGEWRGEVRGEDNIHPNAQVKFSTGGGGARYWNKSNLNITGLLEGNQSTWRREQGGQIPRVTLVARMAIQSGWWIRRAGPHKEECRPWALSLVVLAAVRSEAKEALLFGTAEGLKASKASMVNAWEALLYGHARGHSARRSGAMFYVRQGMTIQDLAYLGRWKSNAVLRYAEEALETQPVNLNFSNREEVELLIRQNKRNKGKAVPVEDDEEKIDEVDLTMEETETKHPPPTEAASVEVNPLVKKQEVDLYVKTTGRSRTKPVHKVTLANWQEPTSKWSTACGWKFAAKSNRFMFVTGSRRSKPWRAQSAWRRRQSATVSKRSKVGA